MCFLDENGCHIDDPLNDQVHSDHSISGGLLVSFDLLGFVWLGLKK